MALKLSAKQQVQLAWLETLPRKLEKINLVVEQLAVNQADDTRVRSVQRLLGELKAQASTNGLPVLGDSFGIMANLLRRPGGHQVKVRGLRELLAGVKINYDGALRSASTPERDAPESSDD